MHKSIQVTSRLLDLLAHIIIAIEIEDIRDEVQSMLIVLDVRVETGEIEAVGKIILVDFAEVLVATRVGKLI